MPNIHIMLQVNVYKTSRQMNVYLDISSDSSQF